MKNARATGVSTLAFDDQIFLLQSTGGISRYFANLMRGISRVSTTEVVFPYRFSRSKILQTDMGLHRLPERPARLSIPLGYLLNGRARGRIRQAEVLHRTYYHPRYLEEVERSIVAHTVHDMIPERLPALFPLGNPHLAKYQHLKSADLILCTSKSTERDLREFYPDLTALVVVVPLGVSSEVFHPVNRASLGNGKFVLFVGSRRGYKDFLVLARAFAQLNDKRLRLIAVGGGPFTSFEKAELSQLGILPRSHQVSASDAELRDFYASALAFVYPSRYEGFGLPTLEAMSTGCPTILARSSSHPEVGGDAALYFEPEDDESLARQLEKLVESERMRQDLAEAGLRRSREFSWERTALKTLEAYSKVTLERE